MPTSPLASTRTPTFLGVWLALDVHGAGAARSWASAVRVRAPDGGAVMGVSVVAPVVDVGGVAAGSLGEGVDGALAVGGAVEGCASSISFEGFNASARTSAVASARARQDSASISRRPDPFRAWTSMVTVHRPRAIALRLCAGCHGVV